MILPPESEQLDYEGEIAVVIGKAGRRIQEAEALSHIAGLTLANEGTIRDWVRHAKFNVTQGKNWDASGAIGPWLVPFRDAAQLDDIALTTRVNGEVRQQDRTSRMIHEIRVPECRGRHRETLDFNEIGGFIHKQSCPDPNDSGEKMLDKKGSNRL